MFAKKGDAAVAASYDSSVIRSVESVLLAVSCSQIKFGGAVNCEGNARNQSRTVIPDQRKRCQAAHKSRPRQALCTEVGGRVHLHLGCRRYVVVSLLQILA